MSSLLFPVYKLSRENTQLENMWDRFWKEKRLWWDSKQKECLYRRSRPKGSLKKDYEKFSKFTRKHLFQNPFFDKVKLCRSATSLKARLYHRCFLVNFAKFVRKHILQNTTERLLLIITVSIVVRGELANKIVNYDAKTKA